MKTPYRPLFVAALICSTGGVASAEPTFATTAGSTISIPHSAGKFDFLRIDSKRRRLLAAHEKDGSADFFDLRTDKLLTRLMIGDAVDTATDPESKFYYVSAQEAERVAIVDAETLREVGSVRTGGPTDAILYDPTNRRVYVTHDGGDEVWVIDPATTKVIASIKIPGVPEFLVYDAATNQIFLNIKSKDSVAVIDPNTNAVVAQWPTAPAVEPHGLALDTALHRIYAAGGNGKLVSIDTKSGAVTASVDIVGRVDQIAFDDANKLVYCAGPGQMSVVSTAGGKLAAMGGITTAATARNVAVDPVTHAVWTTFTDGTNSFAKSWQPRKP